MCHGVLNALQGSGQYQAFWSLVLCLCVAIFLTTSTEALPHLFLCPRTGGVHPFFQLLDLSTWEASQISSGRNIPGSYLFYSHGEKGSLFGADCAAAGILWLMICRGVGVGKPLIKCPCLMRLQLATTVYGAHSRESYIQRIDRGQC